MEIRHLLTFVKTAHFSNISRAAELLGYSQAAATIQLKQLEAELGTKLFDRIGHRLVITADGQKFLPYANQILQDVNKAVLAMEPEESLTGIVRVGTVESLLTPYMDRILTEFHLLHPNASVQVITDTTEVLIDMLNADELDLMYLFEKPFADDKWIRVFEKQEPVVFIADPDCPLCGEEHLTVEDLLDQPFILTEQNANYRRSWDRYLSTHNLVHRPFLEISSTRFITHALKTMSGVSLLPYFVVEKDLKEGKLKKLNVEGFDPEMYRQLFYHVDKWSTREMTEFIRIASED